MYGFIKLECLYSNIFLITISYPDEIIVSYISNKITQFLSYPKWVINFSDDLKLFFRFFI